MHRFNKVTQVHFDVHGCVCMQPGRAAFLAQMEWSLLPFENSFRYLTYSSDSNEQTCRATVRRAYDSVFTCRHLPHVRIQRTLQLWTRVLDRCISATKAITRTLRWTLRCIQPLALIHDAGSSNYMRTYTRTAISAIRASLAALKHALHATSLSSNRMTTAAGGLRASRI